MLLHANLLSTATAKRRLLQFHLGLSLWLSVSAGSLSAPTTLPTAALAYNYAAAHQLFRRQSADCPAGTYLCSTSLGTDFSGICCQNNQVCELDDSNQPACCPSGAVCTGTAPDSPAGQPTASASFVANTFFPFPYMATSLDQGECSSALSQCSENYDTCVTELEGGSNDFAVTIVVPGGGGTTVAASHPSLGTSATPVCSSLSSQACFGLEPSHCDQPTSVNGVVIESGSLAKPTAYPVGGAVAAGFGVAMLGLWG
ncbi:hypothetical protein VD0004_g6383 [Verticillium dahliae]|nr:hypothetical protein VD0004_g6383 [Verticillium dahliae]PNH71456.1 hypothetical protein VD0001_g6093 [Verticillium dahliae]